MSIFKDRIHVEVTQQDIDTGTRRSVYSCPIALSLKRQLNTSAVIVRKVSILVIDKYYVPPLEAVEFMGRFDNKLSVEPFSFDMEDGYE